jgi:predicted neutral ceramidase superfamily lipid hydrolase
MDKSDDRSDQAARGSKGQSPRDETEIQRLDRNWGDLLQELRVLQTGVQLLTGFLLTLPFQPRFGNLETFQRNAYLATVSCAIGATGFLIAPVSMHRVLFRRQQRRRMVAVAQVFALVGIVLLGCAVVGVVMLTFSLVTGQTGGLIAAGVAATQLLLLWAVVPLRLRSMQADEAPEPGPTP